MPYDQLLKRAWAITWRHKALWVFGIALALFGGRMAAYPQYNFEAPDLRRLRPLTPTLARELASLRWFRWAQAALPSIMAVAAALAAVAVVLWVVGIVVRYTSAGAMISMVDDVETRQASSFSAGLNKGWRRFPRLLAFELLLGLACCVIMLLIVLVLAAIAALLAVPGIAMVTAGGQARAIGIIWLVAAGALFFFLFLLVALALALALSVVSAWAARACVLGMQGVFQSIRTGVSLLRQRAGASLSVWLVLALVRLCLGLAAMPVVLVALALGAGLGMALWQTTQQATAVAIYVLCAFVALGIVGASLGGIYVVFTSAYWTLAYRSLVPLAEKA